jgi:hypothetical protein
VVEGRQLLTQSPSEDVPVEVTLDHDPGVVGQDPSTLFITHHGLNRHSEFINPTRVLNNDASHFISNRFVTSTRATSNLRDSTGRRLKKDHPEALRFQPKPTTPTIHHHHVTRR